MKVPNGYKLYQWAYKVPCWGDFIRVFDGLYDAVPENIAEIAAGPHSYIVPFYASKAYRVGLAQLIDNYPVPEEYPFPDYMLQIAPTGGKKVSRLEIKGTKEHWWKEFDVGSIEELPSEYQDVSVIGSWNHPALLLELFDVGFNLNNPDLYWGDPYDHERKARLKAFENMVEAAIAQEKTKKNIKKQVPHKE